MNYDSKIRIYVDFNSVDESNNVVINTTVDGKLHLTSVLMENMLVTLYDETLEVNGQVKRNENIGFWVAVPDWSTIRHLI